MGSGDRTTRGEGMDADELAVDARGLVKRFGDVLALDGLDLRVRTGEIRGLVGPNGAGKTTLLRTLLGLIRADTGFVRVLGKERGRPEGHALDGVAGFVEDPRFYPYLTGRRNLQLLAKLDSVAEQQRVAEVLETSRLGDKADARVGGYSTGMRQRLGMAASLLRSPMLLLLDEPTVGLDPEGARYVRDLIRSLPTEGITVVLSSHNMEELDGLCDSVTVIRSGRAVWDGAMDRLRSEAPAPAHRLWTSNDGQASELARSRAGVKVVADPDGGLTVTADSGQLDAYVIELGRAGIAVRRLELFMTPLESLYFELTGARTEPGEPVVSEEGVDQSADSAGSLGASR